jgi:hypothetical protein
MVIPGNQQHRVKTMVSALFVASHKTVEQGIVCRKTTTIPCSPVLKRIK